MKKCGICKKEGRVFDSFWVVPDIVGDYHGNKRIISKTVYGKACRDCIVNSKYSEERKGPYCIIPAKEQIEYGLYGNDEYIVDGETCPIKTGVES